MIDNGNSSSISAELIRELRQIALRGTTVRELTEVFSSVWGVIRNSQFQYWRDSHGLFASPSLRTLGTYCLINYDESV